MPSSCVMSTVPSLLSTVYCLLSTVYFLMCDEWMPPIQLPLTLEEFRQLPRNAAYKYEYLNKTAYLSPRPKYYHALLEMRSLESDELIEICPLHAEELSRLDRLFADAFRYIQPYGCLDDDTRLEAARQALERTRTGVDGPWIEQASFVAKIEEKPVGAILITLLPEGDPCDWESYHWTQAPPSQCIELPAGASASHLDLRVAAPKGTRHRHGSAGCLGSRSARPRFSAALQHVPGRQ